MGVKLLPPRLLTLADDVTLFESGNLAIDEWFRRYAKLALGSGTSKTYVVCTDSGEVAGFYSIATGQVLPAQASARALKGVGQHPIPVIVLTRLAVDLKFQGTGLGHGLLRDCGLRVLNVAKIVGVRALVTHAKDEHTASFYKRFGFEQSPIDDLQLMVLIKDLKAALQG